MTILSFRRGLATRLPAAPIMRADRHDAIVSEAEAELRRSRLIQEEIAALFGATPDQSIGVSIPETESADRWLWE